MASFPEHAVLPDGRVRLYAKASGKRYDRLPDSAADMLASGDFTTDLPTGNPASAPPVSVTSSPEPSAAIAPSVATPPKSRGKK